MWEFAYFKNHPVTLGYFRKRFCVVDRLSFSMKHYGIISDDSHASSLRCSGSYEEERFQVLKVRRKL